MSGIFPILGCHRRIIGISAGSKPLPHPAFPLGAIQNLVETPARNRWLWAPLADIDGLKHLSITGGRPVTAIYHRSVSFETNQIWTSEDAQTNCTSYASAGPLHSETLVAELCRHRAGREVVLLEGMMDRHTIVGERAFNLLVSRVGGHWTRDRTWTGASDYR